MGLEAAVIGSIIGLAGTAIGAGVSLSEGSKNRKAAAQAQKAQEKLGQRQIVQLPAAPNPLEPPVSDEDEKARRGILPTMATSPLGDQSDATVTRSKLLGN